MVCIRLTEYGVNWYENCECPRSAKRRYPIQSAVRVIVNFLSCGEGYQLHLLNQKEQPRHRQRWAKPNRLTRYTISHSVENLKRGLCNSLLDRG